MKKMCKIAALPYISHQRLPLVRCPAPRGGIQGQPPGGASPSQGGWVEGMVRTCWPQGFVRPLANLTRPSDRSTVRPEAPPG